MIDEVDKGVKGSPFHVHHAKTKSYLEWDYRSWRKKFCRTIQQNVKLTITYTLPKVSKEVTNPEILTPCNSYFDALFTQQKNHAEIGKVAAQKVYDVLKGSFAKNCNKLNNILKNNIKLILDWHSKQHVSYDIKTNHGETEGAPFSYIYLSKLNVGN